MKVIKLISSLASVLILLPASPMPAFRERIVNPAGWNFPDPSKLAILRTEDVVIPGIPIKIIREWRRPNPGSKPYFIYNEPHFYQGAVKRRKKIKERVDSLATYRSLENRLFCYSYLRLNEHSGAAEYSFICDLDDDGCFESQFYPDSDEAEERLLSFIIKIKLGLSEDAMLVRRIITSVVLDLKAGTK